MEKFNASTQERQDLLKLVNQKLETYYAQTKTLKVSSEWDVNTIRKEAQHFSLESGNQANTVLQHAIEGLSKFAVHTPHPNYFGLFNPRSSFVSILGDLIVATLNPQLAAWSHSPFANEIERYLIQEFGRKFGYQKGKIDGTFCTGGAESNLTAVISALNARFPDFNESGVLGIGKLPLIYCSKEAHHSIAKAAKATGLGTQAVRSIEVNEQLQINTTLLQAQIKKDKQAGYQPFMVIGTAGTTGIGAIDDLKAIHQIATQENLWFHVDAAYGGAAVISQKHKEQLNGIHLSDSITLDIHKWFSVPMGASLFLTQKTNILHQSFGIKTKYMPKDGDATVVTDPYTHSIQWSRRFIGLKVYLPIAIYGWKGYEKTINHQIEMGNLLRGLLREKGWKIKNNTQLPIVCFTHPDFKSNPNAASNLVEKVVDSGKAWLSVYPIAGENTLRACITNYATTAIEVQELIDLLEEMK